MRMHRYLDAGILRNSRVRHLKRAKCWEGSAIILDENCLYTEPKWAALFFTPMVSYGTWDEDTQGKIEVGCEVCGNAKHKHGHHHKMDDKHHKRHEHHKHHEEE